MTEGVAPGALDGLRVLELGGGIAAGYATRLLADLGADVVKIEPPDGDETRHTGPFPGDLPHPERSGLFAYLNTNKKSATLRVATPTGRALFLKLCAEADVVVESLTPPHGDAIGLTPAALLAANPDLVVTSITPFGHTGPYRDAPAYDATTGALGGINTYLGEVGRPLLVPPYGVVDQQAGLNAAVATLVAVLAGGAGQHVDVAVAEVWATNQNGMGTIEFIYGGRSFARIGRGVRGGPYPNAILPCKDGYVRAICIQRREWERLIALMGNPEWAADPRFQDRVKMNELYSDELDGHLIAWMADKTKEEVFQLTQGAGVPFGPVYDIADVTANPAYHEWFETVDHPELPGLRQVAAPFEMTGTPPVTRRPAPLLGADTADVLGTVGIPVDGLPALRAAGVI